MSTNFILTPSYRPPYQIHKDGTGGVEVTTAQGQLALLRIRNQLVEGVKAFS